MKRQRRRLKKSVKIGLSIFLITLVVVLVTSYIMIKPHISLNGDQEITIGFGDNYKELGSVATILNKDISKSIKIDGNVDTSKTGSYTITYIAKSKLFKRSNKITRMVKVIDNKEPVIELVNSDISLEVGDEYKEPGYKATDNCDGDITNIVETTSNLDSNKPGTYTITYSVKDKANNTKTVTRKITVTEKKVKKTTTSSNTGTGKGLAILMYHYFYDPQKGETGKDANWMDIHAFEEQMKYLSDNNYYFPTWDEVYQFINGEITLPNKSIVVTVDDGHTSFFNLAYPVINKYNVKATAFIITSKAGGTTFKKYLSDHVYYRTHTHNMHRGGCSGGHGGIFRCIEYAKGIDDLKTSTDMLGSKEVIAYPYGDVTNNVLKITKDSGIKVGVTTKNSKAKKGMDPLQLPRVRMFKGITLTGFINSI